MAGLRPFLAAVARMTEFLLQVAAEAWSILMEASFLLLLGFVLAGVFAILVPASLLKRFLGRGKIRSVLWASAIGTPLPLCSCGVLPTALGLARQGATPGATVAFLITTPEVGIDSIALSYALMDPVMTVLRPVAAFVTGVTAGIATNFLGVKRPAVASFSLRCSACSARILAVTSRAIADAPITVPFRSRSGETDSRMLTREPSFRRRSVW